MKIFAEDDLSKYLDNRRGLLRADIATEDANQLLNMNQTKYVEYLVSKHRVESVTFDWDGVSASHREEMIPAEHFPGRGFMYNVEPGRKYPKLVITYHIPFTGDANLLRLKPSKRILWTFEVRLNHSSISFDIVNFSDQAEDIKQEAAANINSIKTQYRYMEEEVEKFNSHLEADVESLVSGRRAELLKRANLVASLGVRVQRADGLTPTFQVPVTRITIAVKPTAPSSAFEPEPAIDDKDYRGILDVVYDLGVNMERLPSIYLGKREEDLRDLFVMQLSPHFASVTGETFNKAGKTDILIRHEGKNVFVAECKFWRGAKGYLSTIDQILAYLTWRDSKAAVICFVRNRELAPVLDQIESTTRSHPCFVKNRGAIKTGWFQFEFHMENDSTRRMFLAVLCFHLPPAAERA